MPSLPLGLPVLLATLWSPPASAVEQTDAQALLYDLRVGGQLVGTREVTLRYLRTEAGDVRVIESYTDFEVALPTGPFRFRNRASARVSNRDASFTSAVDENGHGREIQARQRGGGAWKVTVIEDGAVRQATLEPGQVDLCSLELLDPVRRAELTGRPRAEVLAAETGTLMDGAVAEVGEGTVTVNGEVVPVQRWTWTPAAGPIELSWSLDGLLVSYTSQWMGKELRASLRELPTARSFGDIGEIPAVIEAGVAEQEL